MHILVTGAAGYIGTTLCPALLQAGHQVTALDLFKTTDALFAPLFANPMFTCVKGDVRNEELLSRLTRDVDVVIPLAALVGAPLCDRDPIAATSTNFTAIEMLTNILSADQRIILPTTNSGYGVAVGDEYCTEESPLNPISLYGKDKMKAEAVVLKHGNSVSLRLATVFGFSPRMRLDLLVNDFCYRAYSEKVLVIFEGHFRRNYIHVRDVVNAMLLFIERMDIKQEVFNVGLSTANLSKIQLARKIEEYVPGLTIIEHAIGSDPDKRDYLVSNEKLEGIGWSPAYSIDDGIKELLKGFVTLNTKRFSNV